MINQKTLAEFMSTSPTSLEEFSDFVNKLIKEHGRETIITNAGIDKNVLYRASNSQNITLDNYYKIKKAFNHQLKSTRQSDYIKELPILGQIVDNTKVRLLNPSQPKTVPVHAPFIEEWSPVFGYLNVSSTCYSGFVYVFSAKGLNDETSINQQCVNRLVMTYPHEEDPAYGMIIEVENKYVLIHPRTRKTIQRISKNNNIKWSKFICMIPFSLMENHKEDPMYEQNIEKLEKKFQTLPKVNN